MWVVVWEPGEERNLFHGVVREGCLEEERSWQTLNNGRKICAMFQAKGTANAREPQDRQELGVAEGWKTGPCGSKENK